MLKFSNPEIGADLDVIAMTYSRILKLKMKSNNKVLLGSLIFLGTLNLAGTAFGGDFSTNIPMRVSGSTTFYVKAQVGKLNQMDFMVDTGSSYTTINKETLTTLQSRGQAQFKRNLRGVLANGTEIKVPVYQLTNFNIGGNCLLSKVEAAVFPGKTRQILGLNALKQAGPFIFSFDPPNLALSHCSGPIGTATN